MQHPPALMLAYLIYMSLKLCCLVSEHPTQALFSLVTSMCASYCQPALLMLLTNGCLWRHVDSSCKCLTYCCLLHGFAGRMQQ
jgi:hypothetical protein